MSCCGNKRSSFARQQGSSSVPGRAAAILPSGRSSQTYFEYTGESSLTHTGIMTGKQYHWAKKGDIQAVDRHDLTKMEHLQDVLKVVM